MHGVELNSVRGSEFCETLTGGFTREFPGGRTPRRVKLQRSGTPRAVEFPEEWNSQGSSGAPRGVELPGEWSSQGWNSQGACFVFAFHFNTDGRGRGNLIPCLSKIIIVKVEYSSRKRSGLGATMVHQLKVERSKPCGQFFPLVKVL